MEDRRGRVERLYASHIQEATRLAYLMTGTGNWLRTSLRTPSFAPPAASSYAEGHFSSFIYDGPEAGRVELIAFDEDDEELQRINLEY